MNLGTGKNLTLLRTVHTGSETLALYLIRIGIKQPGREAAVSNPSSTEVLLFHNPSSMVHRQPEGQSISLLILKLTLFPHYFMFVAFGRQTPPV